MGIFYKLVTIMLMMCFTGCSTYPSKFKCGDAKGLGCVMVRDVDRQIDSGAIEEAYNKNKKCTKGKCKSLETEALKLKKRDQAYYHKELEEEITTEEDKVDF